MKTWIDSITALDVARSLAALWSKWKPRTVQTLHKSIFTPNIFAFKCREMNWDVWTSLIIALINKHLFVNLSVFPSDRNYCLQTNRAVFNGTIDYWCHHANAAHFIHDFNAVIATSTRSHCGVRRRCGCDLFNYSYFVFHYHHESQKWSQRR